MKSFILITFGVMGFAFYELSGGADFDAEELRISRVDTSAMPSPIDPKPQTQVAQAAPAVVTQTDATDDQTNTVSRNNVTLASVQVTPQFGGETTRAGMTFQTVGAVDMQTDEIEKSPTIILPSLITGAGQAAVVQQVTAQVEAEKLTRVVSGNRVNVRGGPGTNYDVVSRLVKGQEVEILSDPGQGWVKLRPVDGGSIGWMADFLLNES